MQTKFFFLTIPLLLCLTSCKQRNSQTDRETAGDSTIALNASPKDSIIPELTDAEVEAQLDSIPKSRERKKSLNEIRFGNWTEKNLYDNDYYRFLRKCFDDCAKGIENENTLFLRDYKSILNDKFVVTDVNFDVFGDIVIDIVFLNQPEKVYQAYVYSDVDEEAEIVTGYHIMVFHIIAEHSNITKEEILQIMKKHPELKLW